jgi:hypothetical protein
MFIQLNLIFLVHVLLNPTYLETRGGSYLLLVLFLGFGGLFCNWLGVLQIGTFYKFMHSILYPKKAAPGSFLTQYLYQEALMYV